MSLAYWNSAFVSSWVNLTTWGECAFSASAGHHSFDGVTMKVPYGGDVYYINQPFAPYLHLVVVKTEFESLNQLKVTLREERCW